MTDSNILRLLDFENPVFNSYIFWSCVLLLKTLFMSVFTTFYRSKNRVNMNINRISNFLGSKLASSIFILFFCKKKLVSLGAYKS